MEMEAAQMETSRIVCGLIFLAFAIGAFIISGFQFREKGFLFNNAYILASQEERSRMDRDKERKRPHYRQSGFAFTLIGIIFLLFAVYIVTDWIWMYIAFWVFVVITVVYAVRSSMKIEKKPKT